jgi:hypothetical protein
MKNMKFLSVFPSKCHEIPSDYPTPILFQSCLRFNGDYETSKEHHQPTPVSYSNLGREADYHNVLHICPHFFQANSYSYVVEVFWVVTHSILAVFIDISGQTIGPSSRLGA